MFFQSQRDTDGVMPQSTPGHTPKNTYILHAYSQDHRPWYCVLYSSGSLGVYPASNLKSTIVGTGRRYTEPPVLTPTSRSPLRSTTASCCQMSLFLDGSLVSVRPAHLDDCCGLFAMESCVRECGEIWELSFKLIGQRFLRKLIRIFIFCANGSF